jgi:hypothetical protein
MNVPPDPPILTLSAMATRPWFYDRRGGRFYIAPGAHIHWLCTFPDACYADSEWKLWLSCVSLLLSGILC